MPIILGLNAGHNASIFLCKENEILGFCSSENLTGVKNQGALFGSHIQRILSEASLTINDIDYVAVASTQEREILSGDGFDALIAFTCNGLNLKIDTEFNSRSEIGGLAYRNGVARAFASQSTNPAYFHQLPQLYEKFKKDGFPGLFSRNIASYPVEVSGYKNKFPFKEKNLNDCLLRRCLFPIKMSLFGRTIAGFFVSHHLAHTYSAYSKSSFSNSLFTLIITADGGGPGPEGNMISIAHENNLYPIGTSNIFAGGPFYKKCGHFFKMNSGKFMGLSGHGIPDPEIVDKFIKHTDQLSNYSKDSAKYLKSIYENKLGLLPETIDSEKSRPDSNAANFAATAQHLFCHMWEKFILDALRKAKSITGVDIKNVCLSGGVALNCPGNAFVQSKHPELNLFIDPSCNDEGLSMGAAFASLDACRKSTETIEKIGSKTTDFSLTKNTFNPFCGQTIDNEELLFDLCNKQKFSIVSFSNQWQLISEKLIEGKIGVIMRGKYEIGPRALGNRSIIALAQIRENHSKVNSLKQREQWRPLAPAVLERHFDEYFEGTKNLYMLCTNSVKRPEVLPAVTHKDGSARVQCVLPFHENFYALLNTLDADSRDIHPVILNTSLNGKQQPMINDCTDMFDILKRDQCDFALTDNYFISKM